MKPDVTHVLNTAAMTLMGEVAPAVSGTYLEGTTNTIAATMMIIGIEQERAAENRVRAIEDLCDLFKSVNVEDAGLTTKLKDACSKAIESYTISSLDAHLSQMKALVIDLQAYAETMKDNELNKQIWEVLERDADRNMIGLG